MARQSLEKSASHAVAAASGMVDACSGVVPSGTGKQMRSSATVYWLYAPRPLTSPVDLISTGRHPGRAAI